ncbi:single-stranded DNA cytosine deaminase-like [Pelodytes ibericus]
MIPMSPQIFYSHYGPRPDPPATHLCYEVYQRAALVASGHLTNGDNDHVEEVFIGERFQDEWRTSTIVWYISWSPCDKCMEIPLRTFLKAHPNVKLHIVFAKRYHMTSESRVQDLLNQGALLRVMSPYDFRWCWNHFVENKQKGFVPWENLNVDYNKTARWLISIATRSWR